MNTKIIAIIFLFFISISAYSTEDGYFGIYQSVKSKRKISFVLNERGVVNLSIKKIEIDTTTLTWNYLARFGSSQVFEIMFRDNKKQLHVLHLFIVEIKDNFFWAAGYYMQYKRNDSDEIIVANKQVVELTHSPLD